MSGKLKFANKEKYKDHNFHLVDPMKSSKKSRNVFTIPKYKTNDCKSAGLSKPNRDLRLQKMPSSGVPKTSDKNTSALVSNYPKISESMTFDYSIDSQSSKARLHKVATDMINNFDPCGTKYHRKSTNYVGKKLAVAPGTQKHQVLTPKSQSPHNDTGKSRKLSKNSKCIKSKCYLLL